MSTARSFPDAIFYVIDKIVETVQAAWREMIEVIGTILGLLSLFALFGLL